MGKRKLPNINESDYDSLIFGLCISCPLDGKYEDNCPFAKIKEQANKDDTIIDLVQNFSDNKKSNLLKHHYCNCGKNNANAD